MDILYCIDSNYCVQTVTSIHSIAKSNLDHRISVHVAFFSQPDRINDELFKSLDIHKNISVNLFYLDDLLFRHLPTTKFFSSSIYGRLVFDRYLDRNISRLLYLDADTIVLKDLRSLWEIDLTKYVAGVVRDHFRSDFSGLDLRNVSSYFNSGMLLINRDLWNIANCEAKVLDVLKTRGSELDWMDQDALNIVLQDQVTLVPIEYNYQPRCADVPASFLEVSQYYYSITRKMPAILHYTTSFKPWNASFRVHYSELYLVLEKEIIPSHLIPKRTNKLGLRDWSLAVKTRMRWYFPRVFGFFRSMLTPKEAAKMYRSGPGQR